MFTIEEKKMVLGRTIEKARRGQKLQTKQLAEFAGVSSSELNRVESGEIWPSELAWERICEFTGLPLGMLAQLKRPTQNRAVAAPSNKSAEEQPVSANIIVLAEHKKKSWQQTFSFEKD